MEYQTVLENVRTVANDFAADRADRQRRRHLDRADFDALAAAGFTHVSVPQSMGGLWQDLPHSTRPICELLRTLAKGDPSVALVSAMHPAVLAFWLCQPEAPAPYTQAWAEQLRFAAQTAIDGHFWGTITSEPGSGGDVGLTKAVARHGADGAYLLSGEKHFGSGSGIASYMVTTAIPDGEAEADWFFLDTREAKWDGSTGMTLRAEWDGHGMTATQSHSFGFDSFPANRLAWPGNLRVVSTVAGAMVSAVFCAVVYGTAQSAVEQARRQLARRKDSLAPYESVEWVRVENESWLMEQAYQGMLNAIEVKGSGAAFDALQAKTALAELAESVTGRICRIVGGGAFHRASPYGAAFEDVRALGFLRPPWVLAYDQIIARTWDANAAT
jgi:alkylation response protein AidB-like acyl-CoA dehydrogenase